ncbi:uncharacterized protein [Amphiura filiformis]|uniref:uncharacterized protein n=1 Tax=Amphiura filiformis TaxID=82378 RepID=UPI003B2184F3
MDSDIIQVLKKCSCKEKNSDSNNTIVIPPRKFYLCGLEDTQRVYQLESGQCILADCDIGTGHLKATHVILDKKTFHCVVEGLQTVIYLCRCPHGASQRDRLMPMCGLLASDFYDFLYQETSQQCCHAEAAARIFDFENVTRYVPAATLPTQVLPNIQQLSLEPLLVAVETDAGLQLLQHNRTKNIVCTCQQGKRHCVHKKLYDEWLAEQSIETDVSAPTDQLRDRRSVFMCISKEKVKTPLSPVQQELYRKYESGQKSFPVHLIPHISDETGCKHGHLWDSADPVEHGWVVGKATIYKEGCSMTHMCQDGIEQPITVYYRPSTGDCNCRLDYDGYHDLLLNLNNTDMVYYGVLFSYLHHMLEGRNPLAACHRAYSHSHIFLSGTKCIPLHKLRLAWNSFARLLDIEWTTGFVCPQCGDQPRIIVCDGTMLGCRKDLLHRLECETPSTEQTPMVGSKHRDRVYIADAKTRKLLAKYASLSKPVTPLTPDEYQELVNGLQHLGLTSLVNLLAQQNNGDSRIAPSSLASFLKDLARNGPASSLLQGVSSETVEKLKDLLARNVPIFQSEWYSSLFFVQREFPVIFKLLSKTHVNGYVPTTIQRLLTDVLNTSTKVFMQSSSRTYSSPTAEELFQNTGFFPALPKLHRKATYTIDKAGQDWTCRTQTECRKYAKGHPTLSPGIFTIFCPHGVCYGFQVMTRYESPEVPFDIFKTRFNVAPEVIIYDNACRLHAYCLNREPEFFRNSLFLVDRMHWHNHRSCSSGYNIDSYGDLLQLNQINTQVNEQANAGLARIKSQLAYMLPDNFIFHAALYLSFRNDKKKAAL